MCHHGSYMSLFNTWWLYVSLWCMHVGVSYSNVWFRTNECFIGQAWLCSRWPVTAAEFCLFNQTICYIVCVVTVDLSWVVLTNGERTISWECSSILWALFVSFPGLCTMNALHTCMPSLSASFCHRRRVRIVFIGSSWRWGLWMYQSTHCMFTDTASYRNASSFWYWAKLYTCVHAHEE